MVFQKALRPCDLDASSFSIGRVKYLVKRETFLNHDVMHAPNIRKFQSIRTGSTGLDLEKLAQDNIFQVQCKFCI